MKINFKSLLFSLILLTTLHTSLMSQFVLKAGAASPSFRSNIDGTNWWYKENISPMGGLFFEIRPLGLIGLETGVYAQRIDFVDEYPADNPYLINWSIPSSISLFPKKLFSPGAGLQLNFINEKNLDVVDRYKDASLSGLIKLNINPMKKLGFELGYNYGITPIHTSELTDQNGKDLGTLKTKNDNLYLVLKYRI